MLRRAGVNTVGRSKQLYIHDRTTDEIRRYGVALLRNIEIDDLDGGVSTNSRYKSLVHGQAPVVQPCGSFVKEVAAITAFVSAGEANRTCLVARTNSLLEEYEAALEGSGIDTYRMSRRVVEDHEALGPRLAAMHRVKGLEFDRLVNDGVVPLAVGELTSEDGAVREGAEKRRRALCCVAVTRARREVLVTRHGEPSAWLAGSAVGAVKTWCGKTGSVAERFGYRSMERTRADGSEPLAQRPRSCCRECR